MHKHSLIFYCCFIHKSMLPDTHYPFYFIGDAIMSGDRWIRNSGHTDAIEFVFK